MENLTAEAAERVYRQAKQGHENNIAAANTSGGFRRQAFYELLKALGFAPGAKVQYKGKYLNRIDPTFEIDRITVDTKVYATARLLNKDGQKALRGRGVYIGETDYQSFSLVK